NGRHRTRGIRLGCSRPGPRGSARAPRGGGSGRHPHRSRCPDHQGDRGGGTRRPHAPHRRPRSHLRRLGNAPMTAYYEPRAAASARCLYADPAVLVVGYETSAPFNPDDGIRTRYPDRFLTPPISEFAVLGASVGAACAGLRPFVSVGTSTFAYYGWSALV